jgi:Family of unknown function (DUF6092)
MDDTCIGELMEEFRDLATYYAAAARGLIVEPPNYGAFRMIDGISRLVDVLEKYDLADETLRCVRKKIDERKTLVMSDPEGFRNLLDDVVSDLTDI